MRVLMLSWEYPPRIVGGISRVVYNLSRELGNINHEVHVITLRENEEQEFEKNGNVFIYRIRNYNIYNSNFIQWVMHMNFAFIEKAVLASESNGGFDIIHGHDWLVAYACRVLKSIFSIPMICTIHATEGGRNYGIHTDEQRYISGMEWWLAYEAYKVIVNSSFMKNELMKQFSLPGDKIVLINNGINPDKFREYSFEVHFRRRFAADNEKIVFFVGRLVHEKGAHLLIEAVPEILKHYNNVKFVIAGKGPQGDYLKHRVFEMGIASRVYFTGYISDEELSKLYKNTDIVVVPSLYEPFGIVALEGMAAGVPVVISDCGGLSDLVTHDVDGMKAYCDNSGSIAWCILELLFCNERVERIVKNAKEKIEEKYTWKIISLQVESLYKSLADPKMS